MRLSREYATVIQGMESRSRGIARKVDETATKAAAFRAWTA